MRYPEEVQTYVDFLRTYINDPKLKTARIFHMYPGKLAYPMGYWDSRLFALMAYNTNKRTCRNLGDHDSLDFLDALPPNVKIRIFADGSTIVILPKHVNCEFPTQAMSLRKAD